MNRTELRIGNLFNPNNPVMVEDWMLLKDSKINFEPISLTEEWLSKMDFHNDEFLGCFTNYELDIKYFFYDVVYFGSKKIDYDLKYVHQLQNLAFAISGKELKIK